MACVATNLAGIAASCGINLGGIRKVMIAPKSAISKIDFVYSVSGDTESVIENITGITMVDDKLFSTYNFRSNTATATSTATVDPVQGSIFYNNMISMQWSKHATEKRIEFETIARAEDLVVMFQDANLKVYLMNFNFPAYVTTGSAEYGTAKADFSGYKIELTSEELFSPIEVNMPLIDSIMDIPLGYLQSHR